MTIFLDQGGRKITITVQNNSSSALVVGPYHIYGQGSWEAPAPSQGDLVEQQSSLDYVQTSKNVLNDMGGELKLFAMNDGGFTLSWDWFAAAAPSTSVTNLMQSKVTATSRLVNIGTTAITVLCQVADA